MKYNLRVYFVRAGPYADEHAIAAHNAKQAKRIAKKEGFLRRIPYAYQRVRVRWKRELRANGTPRTLFMIPMG